MTYEDRAFFTLPEDKEDLRSVPLNIVRLVTPAPVNIPSLWRNIAAAVPESSTDDCGDEDDSDGGRQRPRSPEEEEEDSDDSDLDYGHASAVTKREEEEDPRITRALETSTWMAKAAKLAVRPAPPERNRDWMIADSSGDEEEEVDEDAVYGGGIKQAVAGLWAVVSAHGTGADDDDDESYSLAKSRWEARASHLAMEADQVIFADADDCVTPVCIVYTAPNTTNTISTADTVGICMAAANRTGAFSEIGHVGLVVGDCYVGVTAHSVHVTVESVREKIAYWKKCVDEDLRLGESESRYRFFGRYVTSAQEVAIRQAMTEMVDSPSISYTKATAAVLAMCSRVGVPDHLIIKWTARAGIKNFTCVTCIARLLTAGGLAESDRFQTVSAMTPERFVDALSENDDFDEVEYEEWNVADLAGAVDDWDRARARAALIG